MLLQDPQEAANDLADEYANRAPEKPGIFSHGTQVYVAKWNQAKTHMYAKRLVGRSWVYASSAIYQLRERNRMPVEEVEKLSAQIGACAWCNRELTDPKSVKRGIGPVCIKRVQGL